MLGKLASGIAWRLFVSVSYIAGLALLIPLVFVQVFPENLDVVPPGTSPILAWVAAGLVTAAFLVRVWGTGSIGSALRGLGWMTFVPGAVGLVLSVVGRDVALGYLARALPRFPEVKDLVALYVDSAVPRVRYLTVGFFGLGAVLLWLGGRLEAYARARQAG